MAEVGAGWSHWYKTQDVKSKEVEPGSRRHSRLHPPASFPKQRSQLKTECSNMSLWGHFIVKHQQLLTDLLRDSAFSPFGFY